MQDNFTVHVAGGDAETFLVPDVVSENHEAAAAAAAPAAAVRTSSSCTTSHDWKTNLEQETCRAMQSSLLGDSHDDSDASGSADAGSLSSDAELDEYDMFGCPRRWTPNQMRAKIRGVARIVRKYKYRLHCFAMINGVTVG